MERAAAAATLVRVVATEYSLELTNAVNKKHFDARFKAFSLDKKISCTAANGRGTISRPLW